MATYKFTIGRYPTKLGNRFHNLTGQRFGRLLVIGFGGIQGRVATWHCICNCGNGITAFATNLKRGKTKSCRCLSNDRVAKDERFDLTNQQFGSWLVISYYKDSRWLCQCVCGKPRYVKTQTLLQGLSRSCGCVNVPRTVTRSTIHGHAARSGWNPAYPIYHKAKRRCRDVTDGDYGGRGIEFRFESFPEFLAAVGERPSLDYSLERIDVNGHYETGNIKWATRAEQCRNRRSNKWLTFNGVRKCATDWANDVGLKPASVLNRIRKGWCDECTLTIPMYKGHCPHRN